MTDLSTKDREDQIVRMSHPTSFAARLKRTMAVYHRTPSSSSSSLDLIDEDDEALLHEPPTSVEAQRRIVIKEFVVRAFLLQRYDINYDYRRLMPLVSVHVAENKDVKVSVQSDDGDLLGHFIKWHREYLVPDSDPPRPFFSVLVIHSNSLDFEGTAADLTNIYKVFRRPIHFQPENSSSIVLITNLSEDD